jgi:hypothetical protein
MTARKPRLTQNEVDAVVVNQVDDSNAWGKPVLVPPSHSPRPKWMLVPAHLESAAKWYVLYSLHRLGLNASATIGSHEAADITVIRGAGDVATIEVKTLTEPLWRREPIMAVKNHFLVFVWYPESPSDPKVPPNVYVWSSLAFRNWLHHRPDDTFSVHDFKKHENAWQILFARSRAHHTSRAASSAAT